MKQIVHEVNRETRFTQETVFAISLKLLLPDVIDTLIER